MPEGKDDEWFLLQGVPEGSRCVSFGVPGNRNHSPEIVDETGRISVPERQSPGALLEGDAEAKIGSLSRGIGSR